MPRAPSSLDIALGPKAVDKELPSGFNAKMGCNNVSVHLSPDLTSRLVKAFCAPFACEARRALLLSERMKPGEILQTGKFGASVAEMRTPSSVGFMKRKVPKESILGKSVSSRKTCTL
jgi:hypothetical protein